MLHFRSRKFPQSFPFSFTSTASTILQCPANRGRAVRTWSPAVQCPQCCDHVTQTHSAERIEMLSRENHVTIIPPIT